MRLLPYFSKNVNKSILLPHDVSNQSTDSTGR